MTRMSQGLTSVLHDEGVFGNVNHSLESEPSVARVEHFCGRFAVRASERVSVGEGDVGASGAGWAEFRGAQILHHPVEAVIAAL